MSYDSQAALVSDQPYRARVRAALLQEATVTPPGWDAVYGNIDAITDRAVYRLAPDHAASYDSGAAAGLAEPSANVTDAEILSGVQAHWDDIIGALTV